MTTMTSLPTPMTALAAESISRLGELAPEIVVVDDTPANLKLHATL